MSECVVTGHRALWHLMDSGVGIWERLQRFFFQAKNRVTHDTVPVKAQASGQHQLFGSLKLFHTPHVRGEVCAVVAVCHTALHGFEVTE